MTRWWLLFVPLFLLGCTTSPPRNTDDLCAIFEEKDDWYEDAAEARDAWGSPIPVMMAILHQESRFRARARPPRKKIFGFIPGPRPSDAYGYSQAKKSTWKAYERSAGRYWADRHDFADAIDFVGWYNAMSRRINEIPADDAANLYFAYHEGNGGYARGRHWDKPWLLDTGARVQANSKRFDAQYAGCRPELEKNWLQRLFS